jgi:hypothetical protein
MSLLIAAHFLKSWNQTGHSHPHFSVNWSLRSSTVCCILQLMVLLDGRMSSSAIAWVFLYFTILYASKALLGIDVF